VTVRRALVAGNREAGVFEFVAFRGLSSEAIAFDAQDPFMAYFRERREPLGSEGRFGEVQVPMAIAQQMQALETRLCLPIVIHDELEGLVLLGPKKSDRAFSEEDVETLVSLTKTLAVAVANARLFTELAKTQAEVAEQESLAITDSLTGLFVRRHFVERSMVELARCKRYNHSCALLMVDLDHYKDINDRHGHLVGDAVLQETAQLLRRHLRDTDVLGRFGGDELIILLVETNTEQAVRLAQRLRRLVEEHPIGVANDLVVAATVSIGLATFPDDADSVELLMARADEALYFAKRAGRNGVMHIHAKAGLPEETPPKSS
jgi:diguanylate cyclase (GGDEF)-like protein